jgi:hypothetical protein
MVSFGPFIVRASPDPARLHFFVIDLPKILDASTPKVIPLTLRSYSKYLKSVAKARIPLALLMIRIAAPLDDLMQRTSKMLEMIQMIHWI